MTDPTLPPDDEIISAHLDGQASPEEAAAVEASGAAQARRAELDAVRALVGAPVTPPAGAREAALTAALAEFDRQRSGPDPNEAPDVAPAAPMRPGSPATGWSRAFKLVTAAAATVIVIIGVLAVIAASGLLSGGGDDLSTASVSGGSQERSAEPRTSTGEAPAAEDRSPSTSARTAPPGLSSDKSGSMGERSVRPRVADLGTITDEAALGRAGRSALDTGRRTPPLAPSSGAADPRRCEPTLRAQESGLGELALVGVARHAGASANVLGFRPSPAERRGADDAVRVYLVDEHCVIKLMTSA
jgi:hypothetical protein